MNALQILTQARDLLAQPNRWTRFYYATPTPILILADVDTSPYPATPIHAPEALCFCSQGAIHKVSETNPGTTPLPDAVSEAFTALAKAIDPTQAARFAISVIVEHNDRATHDEVIAAFDRAIETLRP